MGYPVRSTGYMFCYNRSMIHLASGFFRRFFRPRGGRFRLDAGQLLYYGVLTIHEQGQTRCCRAEIRPYCVNPLDHTESMLCGSFLVWLHFCSGKTARPLPTMDLRVIFVFLRCRRRPPRGKGQKAPERHAARRDCPRPSMVPDMVPKMDIDRTKFLSAIGEKSVRFVSEIGQIGGDLVVTVSPHLLPRAFRQQRTFQQ